MEIGGLYWRCVNKVPDMVVCTYVVIRDLRLLGHRETNISFTKDELNKVGYFQVINIGKYLLFIL